MNFKTFTSFQVKFSLFDQNLHDTLINDYDKEILTIKEIDPFELEEMKDICKDVEYLCECSNVFFLPTKIDLLCEKFKSDFQFSLYLFRNSLISKNSFSYLVSLYSSQDITPRIRWLLVKFFIEASFHSPNFSYIFCTNSHALNYILDTFADPARHDGHLDDLTKLIYNIVSDSASLFPLSYVVKLTVTAFQNKSITLKIIEKYSFFLMNFFRFYTNQEKIDPFDPETVKMVEMLEKWFQVQYGFTFEHMMWCYYFWFVNSPDFTPIFFETYFFDIVMNQLQMNFNEINETCLKISLSIITMSILTIDDNYLRQIYEQLRIHTIISLIFDEYSNVHDETKQICLRLISNYAARGYEFIDNLLENQMHTKILDNFDDFPNLLKIECGYCFAISILDGNEEQANYFSDEYSINLLIDCLDLNFEDLILYIFNSFVRLIELKLNVIDYIDPDLIDELANDFQHNEEITAAAQAILSFYQSQE